MIPARRAAAVVAALAVDHLFGEPPEDAHPTVLMGRAISCYEKHVLCVDAGSGTAVRNGLAGLLLALALPTLAFACSRATLSVVPAWARWPVAVASLWTTISMRGLAVGALAVERELEKGDLEAARRRVGEIVGRDTENLSETEVSRAAIESVAENTSDGIVAPMLYGFLFGAPGAIAYKAINTLDSMVGHPDPPYTHFGRTSARLDDLANLAPSRLTALGTAVVSARFARAWRTTRLYGPLTKSPNAGWAEAAFAGGLDLALGGTNSYGGVVRESPALGEGRPPVGHDIQRAVQLMRRTCLMFAALLLVPPAAAHVAGGLQRSVRPG